LLEYQYDRNGNRKQMTASGSESYTVDYVYDANNRLTTETKTTSASVNKTNYYYDPNGNQYGKTHETISSSSGAKGYLLSSNLASSELNRYNGLNQLVSARVGADELTYSYYPSGLRASKKVNTNETKYILDGANVVLESVGGSVTNKYLRGHNLISSTIGGTEYWYYYNAHGDVVLLTDSNSVIKKAYVYDAFGVEKNTDPNDTNPFRYCGEYFDSSSGTYYLRARYYQPTTGRFTQEDTYWNTRNMIYGDNPQDPLGLNQYKPNVLSMKQSGNLYVYCVNNPITHTDSTGFILQIIGDETQRDILFNALKERKRQI